MNNFIKYFGMFLCGGGLGVLSSYKYFESKYKKIATEEISEVREVYKKKAEIKEDSNIKIKKNESPIDIKNEKPQLFDMVKKLNYIPNKHGDSASIEEESDDMHIIYEDEVGQEEDYEVVFLNYVKEDESLMDMDFMTINKNILSDEVVSELNESDVGDNLYVCDDKDKKYYEINIVAFEDI